MSRRVRRLKGEVPSTRDDGFNGSQSTSSRSALNTAILFDNIQTQLESISQSIRAFVRSGAPAANSANASASGAWKSNMKWVVLVLLLLVLYIQDTRVSKGRRDAESSGKNRRGIGAATTVMDSVGGASFESMRRSGASGNGLGPGALLETESSHDSAAAAAGASGGDEGRIHIRQFEQRVLASDEDVERTRRVEEDLAKEREIRAQSRSRQAAREMRAAEQNALGELERIESIDDRLTSNVENHCMFKQQGKGVKFTGLDFGMLDGVNVTKVSLALYRLIKSERILSMIDYPCSENAKWMPHLLSLLDFELRGFRYYCVDSDAAALEAAQASFTGAALPEFVLTTLPSFAHFPKVADLVFSFRGLQTHPQNGIMVAWSLLKTIRKSRIKLMLLGNSQGSDNYAHGAYVNVRTMPFSFREPLKIIRGVTDEEEQGEKFPVQLVFYKVGEERKEVTVGQKMLSERTKRDEGKIGGVVVVEDED
eukprot:CAMPEP_0185850868 /NCGR_PEP_ID=MMETSP1354-20130828/4836_1 /TAXON_ID=708628 /ORGANISM="Erythrolobus madagascarensis, Strain CCMP3276" /LENGTH=481 /DNA_ID=CAMNT_0028551595 /DNA_START=54 /DNA_END=1499 /DNA_ORIENTATION=-